MSIQVILLCLLLHYCRGIEEDARQQQIVLQKRTVKNLGTIVGFLHEEQDAKAEIFLSVPYAKPPIGDLRFKYPEPVESWRGKELDATSDPPWCIQFWYPDDRLETRNQSEDCLYMNIMKPHNPKSNVKYPVLVWIHGGSYQVGGASMFPVNGTVKNIVSRGVIFVAVNYRLGPLGFLSSLNSVMSGNIGLEDQLMALQWIRDNIADFDGDPNNVTLGGESAGAACVSLLSLSPKAKGLFHRAIIRSGSSLAPWAVRSINTDLNSGRVIRFLNCSRNAPAAVTACLRQTDVRQIKRAWRYLANDDLLLIISRGNHKPAHYNHPFLAHTYFTPVVDGYRHNESIIPTYPEELMQRSATLPLLIGTTTGECTGYVTWLTYMENAGSISLETMEFFVPSVQYMHPELVKETARRHYVTEHMRHKSFDYKKQLVKIASDQNFVAPAVMEARLYAKRGIPVYTYSFDYETTDLYVRHSSYGVHNVGAAHGFDMVFLFQSTLVMDPIEKPISWNPKDAYITDFLGETTTNFIKHGNPYSIDANAKPSSVRGSTTVTKNLNWPKYSQISPVALLINGSDPTPIVDYNSEADRFWHDTIGAIQALVIPRSQPELVYPYYPNNNQQKGQNGHKDPDVYRQSDFDYRVAFYATLAATVVLAFVLIVTCLLHYCGRKDLKAALAGTTMKA